MIHGCEARAFLSDVRCRPCSSAQPSQIRQREQQTPASALAVVYRFSSLLHIARKYFFRYHVSLRDTRLGEALKPAEYYRFGSSTKQADARGYLWSRQCCGRKTPPTLDFGLLVHQPKAKFGCQHRQHAMGNCQGKFLLPPHDVGFFPTV